MEDNQVLRFEYKKGIQYVFPCNKMVNNWLFTEEEHSEAKLAHYLAEVAEKNGLTNNDVIHIYPLVLRMLKSNIQWAQ